MGDPNQWRLKKAMAGGGSHYDSGIYCLYTIRYLTGLEPVEVAAHTYSPPNDARFKEVEATIDFRLSFANGLQATCLTSYAAHQSNQYRVLGSDAWAGMDPAFNYRGLRMMGARKLSESFEDMPVPQREDLNQFALELDHFSLRLIENQPVSTPGEEGRQDIDLMQQIYAAAAGGKPVAVNSPAGTDVSRDRLTSNWPDFGRARRGNEQFGAVPRLTVYVHAALFSSRLLRKHKNLRDDAGHSLHDAP